MSRDNGMLSFFGKEDLANLSLGIPKANSIDLIHQKHGSTLYRVRMDNRSYILKWFSEAAESIEVRCYSLLAEYGVPTLPVHWQTENALLLEDLERSQKWRLARESDIEQPETGIAIAEWYRKLHKAGRSIVKNPDGAPEFLTREADELNADVILSLGEKLGLANTSAWKLSVEHIEKLKQALHSFPETLNYNDFHWTNLALSRAEPLTAIVYDYHLLGIGSVYSDYRNVCGSLGERAKEAFLKAYGPVDEQAAIFDAPISLLYSLLVASRLPTLPSWAKSIYQQVRRGKLEESLKRAIRELT
jgi:hypothetical protein